MVYFSGWCSFVTAVFLVCMVAMSFLVGNNGACITSRYDICAGWGRGKMVPSVEYVVDWCICALDASIKI